MGKTEEILGLRKNWIQFALLVVINAFVGGMVGLERSILPQIAESEFHLAVHTAILSFIVVFGIVKALANLTMGSLADHYGRKKLLIAGWLFGLPVPLLLMFAPNWGWVLVANVFLGVNQGLAWSSTVVMKIDLVGKKNRGLAMGLNEFAGYLAVGGVALGTAWLAGRYGLRPYPFVLGLGIALLGLILSWAFVKDTRAHAEAEIPSASQVPLSHLFWQTTWKHQNLGTVTFSGLVNNLNDGMMWGLLPLFMAAKGYDLPQIGVVTAIYPAVWGMGQLLTGKLADHFCHKKMLLAGMALQGLAIAGLAFAPSFSTFILLAVLLGTGTALVYPTFLASIAANTHPGQRARSLGIFRFWRDLGYAIGALLTGIAADLLGTANSILLVGGLTLLAALIIRMRMHCPGSGILPTKSFYSSTSMEGNSH